MSYNPPITVYVKHNITDMIITRLILSIGISLFVSYVVINFMLPYIFYSYSSYPGPNHIISISDAGEQKLLIQDYNNRLNQIGGERPLGFLVS